MSETRTPEQSDTATPAPAERPVGPGDVYKHRDGAEARVTHRDRRPDEPLDAPARWWVENLDGTDRRVIAEKDLTADGARIHGPAHDRHRLVTFVRSFYDAQNLRLRFEGRVNAASATTKAGAKKKAARPAMPPADAALLAVWQERLESIEKDAFDVIHGELKRDPVWRGLLDHVPGVGPTMGGVLLGGGFNIYREDTPSKMWAACGLAPGQRRERGKRAGYNPWLKTKVVGVLADCVMKASVRSGDAPRPGDDWTRVEHPWMGASGGEDDDDASGDAPATATSGGARWVRSYAHAYFEYRHRLETAVGPCVGCTDGKRKNTAGKLVVCWNCGGTARGPRGKGPAHRRRMALRYMVKMLLLDLWTFWRGEEGLPVRPSYHEEKHGGHRDGRGSGYGPEAGARAA